MHPIHTIDSLLIAALIVLAFSVIGFLTAHLRRDPKAWAGGLALALALVAVSSWMTVRDEHLIAAERDADFETQMARLGCAPKKDDDGPLIVLLIDSTADPHSANPARTTGCQRVANRAWMWWHLGVGAAPIYSASK